MARLTIALSLLLLAGNATAGRTLELVENGIEAALADVTMPGGAAGTLIYRTCEACDPESRSVTTDTRYSLGGTSLPRESFMQEVEQLRQSDAGERTVVGIFYDRDSGRVTRIALYSPGK